MDRCVVWPRLPLSLCAGHMSSAFVSGSSIPSGFSAFWEAFAEDVREQPNLFCVLLAAMLPVKCPSCSGTAVRGARCRFHHGDRCGQKYLLLFLDIVPATANAETTTTEGKIQVSIFAQGGGAAAVAAAAAAAARTTSSPKRHLHGMPTSMWHLHWVRETCCGNHLGTVAEFLLLWFSVLHICPEKLRSARSDHSSRELETVPPSSREPPRDFASGNERSAAVKANEDQVTLTLLANCTQATASDDPLWRAQSSGHSTTTNFRDKRTVCPSQRGEDMCKVHGVTGVHHCAGTDDTNQIFFSTFI